MRRACGALLLVHVLERTIERGSAQRCSIVCHAIVVVLSIELQHLDELEGSDVPGVAMSRLEVLKEHGLVA